MKILLTIFLFILYVYLLALPDCPQVDIPEEWEAISKDPSKPDTMTCYLKDNKLYFQFK